MTTPVYAANLTVYDPAIGTTRVLRFATTGFTTGPADSPANTYFDGRLDQPVDISRSLFANGNATTGRAKVAVGDLVLLNSDGALDDFRDYGLDGRLVEVYRSTSETPVYPTDFDLVIRTTMLTCDLSTTKVTVKLRDRQFVVEQPLQTTKYLGTGGLEGGDEIKGKPKPVCYGVVKNVPAVLVDPVKLIYQVNDGALTALSNVYDRGALLFGGAWTANTPVGGSITQLYGLAFAEGRWVVVGEQSGGSPGGISTSDDSGATWTQRTNPFTTGIVTSVANGDGVWVACGQGGTVATSPTGTTWTSQTLTGFGGNNALWVGYARGVFVVVGDGGKISTSTDAGVTWVSRTSGTASNLKAVAWGPGGSGSVWVAVGASGAVTISEDEGVTWALQTSGTSDTMFGVAWGVRGFLAAGDDGNIIVSNDGRGWSAGGKLTPRASAAQNDSVYDVQFAAGSYVVTMSNGYAYVSTDGDTWGLVDPGFGTAQPYGVGYGAGLWMVVGEGGEFSTSKSVGAAYGSSADLLDDTLAPAAGSARAYLAGGYFRLGSIPVGQITADVTQGANAAARTAGQIFAKILDERAGLTTGDWSASDITALDSADNSEIGFWQGTEEAIIADALDAVAKTPGAWWTVDKSNVFRIEQLTAPSGTPDIVITANDLVTAPQRITPSDSGRGLPAYRVKLNHTKNYTVQTTDLAGGVTDERRAFLAEQWRSVVETDTDVQTAHPLSPAIEEDTLYTVEADATAEAERRLALRSVQRDVYELVVKLNDDTVAIDLGDVVEFIYPRFGLGVIGSSDEVLEGGGLFRVLDVQPNAKKGEIRWVAWGRPTGSANLATDLSELFMTDDGDFLITAPE